MEETFVYDDNIEKLLDTVEKLNRRADKLGQPPILLYVGDIHTVYSCPGNKEPLVSLDPYVWGVGKTVVQHRRAEVALSGEPPRLAGWNFMAVVDHLSNGVISKYPPADPDFDLTPFRGNAATCDHCQTIRNRHETFIIRHDEGDVKRVGRTCLADFLGHHGDPAKLLGQLNLWSKAFDAVEEATSSGTGAGRATLELHTFLALVSEDIRNNGWLSRGKAYEQQREATADRAQAIYWSEAQAGPIGVKKEDEEIAKNAIQWVRALTDEEVENSDYLYNLRAVCTDDYILPKRGGLAASALAAAGSAFLKARENKNKANEWIGEIKERISKELTLVGTSGIDGHFGFTLLHRFEDPQGNLLVWFSTNPKFIPDSEGKRTMNVGETLTLTGTVKAHKEYKDRKQTVLTRVGVKK